MMGYNLDDYFVNRPKPRSAVFYSLLIVFFISWSYREGASKITYISEMMFIVSITALLFYAAYLLLAYRTAKALATKRYMAYLCSLSQSQLQLLLARPDLSPRSTKLVRAHLAQHYPFT